jgi:hypothetical protein
MELERTDPMTSRFVSALMELERDGSGRSASVIR